MKNYDLISIGTGSAMSIVEAMIRGNPTMKIAVVEKDEPGGICLTRGCIPSKILLYPAEMIRTVQRLDEFGIDVKIDKIDFKKIMGRMRNLIDNDIDTIRQGLSSSKNIDFYPTSAEFISPYTLKIGKETIRSRMILLCTGSKPTVPPIKGIDKVGYLTSDTLLRIKKLPRSIAVIGGGYIAAEYGHFLSAMGSDVTIIGRNPQFLPEEEPEISLLAKKEIQKHIKILTNCEVTEVRKARSGSKQVLATNRENKGEVVVDAEEILLAVGRSPNTDILHPEKAGIRIDEKGWVSVDEHLETSQTNVWALGDANGKYLFKHVANYEAKVVYFNAVLKQQLKVDYHAIPHAVFTYPEIASVGLRESEAIDKYDKERILIGFQKYEDTAKGEAMAVRDYFVKVIVEENSMKILGAHIIGPHASILIQEIINLMYTNGQSALPIVNGMHIHPALSEVVERAFSNLMIVDHYHHMTGFAF